MMYYYLYWCIVAFVIWIIIFLRKRELRKPLLFGSILYPAITIPTFFGLRILSKYTSIIWNFIPDYWDPDTLFNLGRITGGFAIEDAIFMFVAGGIAMVFYELFYNKKIIKSREKSRKSALIVFILATFLVAKLFTFNPIYILIIPSVIGWLLIILQRNDLINSSLKGALLFLGFYFIGILAYNNLFSNPVPWTLKNFSGIIISGIPIEEFGYGFTFALFWGPLYKYLTGKKNDV